MYQGFYNLTSGMLTQGRNLNVIANNMTNVSTPGYKSDQYTASTFDEVLISRIGNQDHSDAEEIGQISHILASSEIVTDYTQGSLSETAQPLDFAVSGKGFFAVETADGRAYTRNGSFSLDEEGYLCLSGQGRILGTDQAPICLVTDKISADASGNLYTQNGAWMGQVGVYQFSDTTQFTRSGQGLFQTGDQPAATEGTVQWKSVEGSNVDLLQQMTDMLTCQRAYQSAAQMSKMYDQVISRVTTEVGKV